MSISKGNSKIGKIPNISLVPVKDCGNCQACKKDCYALKAYRMYPSARKAWNENSDLVRTNPEKYWTNLDEFLAKQKPEFFRYHVAGDILNQAYLDEMFRLAH